MAIAKNRIIFEVDNDLSPVPFEGQTKVLGKPRTMTDDECGDLPVFNDGVTSISCWEYKVPFMKRLKFLFSSGINKIWIGVLGGESQPPIWLSSNAPKFKASDD